jgi:hypothetical protein
MGSPRRGRCERLDASSLVHTNEIAHYHSCYFMSSVHAIETTRCARAASLRRPLFIVHLPWSLRSFFFYPPPVHALPPHPHSLPLSYFVGCTALSKFKTFSSLPASIMVSDLESAIAASCSSSSCVSCSATPKYGRRDRYGCRLCDPSHAVLVSCESMTNSAFSTHNACCRPSGKSKSGVALVDLHRGCGYLCKALLCRCRTYLFKLT